MTEINRIAVACLVLFEAPLILLCLWLWSGNVELRRRAALYKQRERDAQGVYNRIKNI